MALVPGRTRANIGDDLAAEPLLLAGLQAWRASAISRDDEFAATLGTLSAVQGRLGKIDQALLAVDESIELLQSLHARPTASYVTVLGNRAGLLYGYNQRDGGVADSQAALDAATELFGSVHPSTLRNLLVNAQTTSDHSLDQGNLKYEDLINRCEDSKQIQSNSTCFRALNALAGNLMDAGKISAAEPLLIRNLELRRAHFGALHSESAVAIASIGALKSKQLRHADALENFDQALSILTQSNAPMTMITAQLRLNRAEALRNLARHQDAVLAFDQAIALYDQLMPGDTVSRCQLRALQALSMLKLGQKLKAQTLSKQALEIGGADAVAELSPEDQQQFQRHFLAPK